MEKKSYEVGRPGAWDIDGLVWLDREVSSLARHHSATAHGAETIRWFFLDAATRVSVPPRVESFEQLLEQAETSLPSILLKRLSTSKGHLDDMEVGTVLGYATASPVDRREWRNLREDVFARIGLELGPPPAPELERLSTFDIGAAPRWRYDVIRVLDRRLAVLADHHAATEIGARSIRWYIWHELTSRPRPIELAEIERQLENAEASIMSSFGDEIRRARGHLADGEVARMVGFRNARPIVEGYYRQLREDVFGRIAKGFGAVDLPEIRVTPDAIDIGRLGAWKVEKLAKVDRELSHLTRAYAKTEAGAQTLRWVLLDRITEDPAPVDLMLIEQRLQKLGASVFDLFGVLERRRKSPPFLTDAKIARFAGLGDPADVKAGGWKEPQTRVLERVDVDGVFDD